MYCPLEAYNSSLHRVSLDDGGALFRSGAGTCLLLHQDQLRGALPELIATVTIRLVYQATLDRLGRSYLLNSGTPFWRMMATRP
jgi:hypothetical protein